MTTVREKAVVLSRRTHENYADCAEVARAYIALEPVVKELVCQLRTVAWVIEAFGERAVLNLNVEQLPKMKALTDKAQALLGKDQSQQQEEGDASKFLADLEAIHKEMGFTDGCNTLTDIREGRAGAMYGDAPPESDEPVTEEWWKSLIGCSDLDLSEDFIIWFCPQSQCLVLHAESGDDKAEDASTYGLDLEHIKTRSQAIALLKALGINLPESPDKEMRKAQ